MLNPPYQGFESFIKKVPSSAHILCVRPFLSIMTDAIAARDKDHPHWNAAGQGVSVVAGTAGHDKVRQMKAVRGILKTS